MKTLNPAQALPVFAALRKRAAAWLLRLLRTTLSPMKEALMDVKVNSALLFSLLGKIAWVLPLAFYSHLFDLYPSYYKQFADAGPEWKWALVILLLIACDMAAILRRAYEWQIVCLGAGALFWLTLARLITSDVPHGLLGLPAAPTAYIYFFAGAGCMIGAYRLIQQHGAKTDAQNWLIIADFVEQERAAGAFWAQDRESREGVAREKQAQEKEASHS